MHPQLGPFTQQLFLDFRAISSPEQPLMFLVITIHQVEGNLAESWYPLGWFDFEKQTKQK